MDDEIVFEGNGIALRQLADLLLLDLLGCEQGMSALNEIVAAYAQTGSPSGVGRYFKKSTSAKSKDSPRVQRIHVGELSFKKATCQFRTLLSRDEPLPWSCQAAVAGGQVTHLPSLGEREVIHR